MQKVLNFKDITTKDTNEKFVNLRNINGVKIFFEPYYYNKGLSGAIDDFFVREKVAELIVSVAKSLPENYFLKVFDCWRPYEVQKTLFDSFYNELLKNHEGVSKKDLLLLTQNYVSLPDKKSGNFYLHSTGGAIDLTLVNQYGESYDMGTDFDVFEPQANTTFYEEQNLKNVTDIVLNRRILYHSMINAGFTNFQNEWWHFDYGNREWSSYSGLPAFYSGVFVKSELWV